MGMVITARALGAAAALALLLAATSCAARDFYVGGRDGWTTNPAEPHNRWAERNRFLVNDTLVFRYNKDVDAVLLVSQSHYDACDTTGSFVRLDGGDSRFVLAVSGPYFFISADAGRCGAGERLIVVVLAVRSPPLPPPPPPKSASSSAPPPPTPTPTSLSAPPSPAPKPASSSAPPPQEPKTAPPPRVPSSAPPALSPSAGNVSSPSPAPMPGTNGTYPLSKSSAAALRASVLACLIVGGAAIL